MQQRSIDPQGARLTLSTERDPETGLATTVEIVLELPPGFPGKIREAIVRAMDQCKVKRQLEHPPAVVATATLHARDTVSRAFVKEDDEAPGEPLPERPVGEHPNRVTPSGLAQLQARLEEHEALRLELARRADNDDSAAERLRYVERDLRYYRRRIESALVIGPDSFQQYVMNP